MYPRTHRGWDKLKMLIQLLYPSRALKLFPPHFSLRDVVLERIDECCKTGERCALLFFHVQQYGEVKAVYPPHVVLQTEETVAEVFADVVRRCVADEDLFVLQRYDLDDYFILLRDRHEEFCSDWLQERTDQIRHEVERELNIRAAAFLDVGITLSSASTRIDLNRQDSYESFTSAMRDVQSLAKQAVHTHLGNYRADIRRIIEEEDIQVLAQPIISLSTGEVEGWEILTRGPKETLYNQPQQLFHFAHLAGMLIPLELLVIQKALSEVENKQNKSPIFINVTVPSLCSSLFYQQVMQQMKRFPRISPSQIVLEITERHAVDDYPSFFQALAAFRKAGFRFAVDDTGAGYSSLHMISELLPEFIKVDRSIIQGIDQHEIKDSVLQALLLIAERIGCGVVAEGIETEAEAAVLIRKNVAYGQGFLFSKPQKPFQEMAVGTE
ncbi:EAL domain-containing protein [Brevibacillus humidisoli]|uniref:EAL domain-containing protein n=1 Tax=Brevibacillus humidisoli TaxID=2895522 RepID=UPI001E3E943C|nr:EAL domain-containing protein [Brevibacillus humidisoli]UFJ39680.1 EAL domain-containing protein [Brevibacillus humidisoli]